MLNVATASISGIITDVIAEKGGITIILNQKVRNKIDSNFTVFIPNTIREEICEKIKKGDEILVENTVVYQKDGNIRFKVESINQVKIVPRTREDLFLGYENAGEKFI